MERQRTVVLVVSTSVGRYAREYGLTQDGPRQSRVTGRSKETRKEKGTGGTKKVRELIQYEKTYSVRNTYDKGDWSCECEKVR